MLKIAGGARVADGLLALGNDVAITENFANRVAKKNWFDVIVHGTKDGLAFKVGGNIIKPQELYNNMLANGYKAGTNIRLISCYSGSLENGAASQLSKLSNAMVVAPTDATFIGNGQIFQAGKTMVSNGGNYKVFKP